MGAELIKFKEVDVRVAFAEMTGGIGPDACIDAVSMESHGVSADSFLDIKQSSDHPAPRALLGDPNCKSRLT